MGSDHVPPLPETNGIQPRTLMGKPMVLNHVPSLVNNQWHPNTYPHSQTNGAQPRTPHWLRANRSQPRFNGYFFAYLHATCRHVTHGQLPLQLVNRSF
nr:hypothetical protein Itr_chr07CG03560 [Ipomoea trifida]